MDKLELAKQKISKKIEANILSYQTDPNLKYIDENKGLEVALSIIEGSFENGDESMT